MGRHRRLCNAQVNPVLQRKLLAAKRQHQQAWKHKQALQEKHKRKPIPVQVQLLNGRRIPLFLDKLDTVTDITRKIASKEHINADLMVVLYNGLPIPEDGQTVKDLWIEADVVLSLTLRNRGG